MYMYCIYIYIYICTKAVLCYVTDIFVYSKQKPKLAPSWCRWCGPG